jgi:hypothetical protein
MSLIFEPFRKRKAPFPSLLSSVSQTEEIFSARGERERAARRRGGERERERNHGFIPENRAGDAFVRAKGTNRARENIREGVFLARV